MAIGLAKQDAGTAGHEDPVLGLDPVLPETLAAHGELEFPDCSGRQVSRYKTEDLYFGVVPDLKLAIEFGNTLRAGRDEVSRQRQPVTSGRLGRKAGPNPSPEDELGPRIRASGGPGSEDLELGAGGLRFRVEAKVGEWDTHLPGRRKVESEVARGVAHSCAQNSGTAPNLGIHLEHKLSIAAVERPRPVAAEDRRVDAQARLGRRGDLERHSTVEDYLVAKIEPSDVDGAIARWERIAEGFGAE